MTSNPKALLLPLLISGLLAGCSSFSVDSVLPDNSVDYRKEKAADKALEVPPDLTSSTIKNRASLPETGGVSVSYSDLESDARARSLRESSGTVAPEINGIDLKRDGQDRWLVIQNSTDAVWNNLLDFWQKNGVLLVEQDPMTGVMRTNWLENRADIKNDFITDAVRSLFDGFYDAGTRDQFRIRLERVDNNVTELYLTHFGMEEKLTTGLGGETDQSVWERRPRDPQLEAEMLRRMMVHMGISDELAKVKASTGVQARQVRSQLSIGGTGSALLINESFARAWRLAGLSLDRVGFVVQDRNRDAGVYYVRYADPESNDAKEKGWLSKLAFWKGDDAPPADVVYQVQVKAAGDDASRVTVHDEQGRMLDTKVAQRILTLMHEQLR